MTDLQTEQQNFVRAGGNLTHKQVEQRLEQAAHRARADHQAETAPRNAYIAQLIVRTLGWLAMGFVSLVMVGGVCVALVLLPAAEYTSVYKGLSLVTSDALIVSLTSASLLIAVIVLAFLKHAYRDALPHKPQSSLMRGLASLLKWVGVQRVGRLTVTDYNERTTLEQNYLNVSRALGYTKWSILGASFIGRLGTLMATYGSLPAGQAWDKIMSSATGTEVLGTVVSVGVLWAILSILDVLVLFVYVSFKNTAGKLDLGEALPAGSGVSLEQLIERYQAQELQKLTLQLTAKRESLSLPSEATPDTPTP